MRRLFRGRGRNADGRSEAVETTTCPASADCLNLGAMPMADQRPLKPFDEVVRKLRWRRRNADGRSEAVETEIFDTGDIMRTGAMPMADQRPLKQIGLADSGGAALRRNADGRSEAVETLGLTRGLEISGPGAQCRWPIRGR